MPIRCGPLPRAGSQSPRLQGHQSREINQLRQNQCTPRSPSMLVSGQSAEIALPGRHRELARRPQEEHSPLSVFGAGRWQA